MQRGNGAVIGKQNTPTTSVATGVWALNEVQRAVLNGAWPAATIVDPYFDYTTLLLHGNGTNGAQNNTFLDSSTNNFTITRNGNTTQGTFTPYGSNWSNYFDGTDDFIYVADSSAFTLGSGDFTVEAWVWTGVTGAQKVISGQIDGSGTTASLSYQLEMSSSDFPRLIIASGGTLYIATSSTTLPKNQWVHVAGVRDGSTLRIYVNGVQYGTQSVTGVTVNDSSANVSVGRHGQYAGLDWNGYISNFRLVKGTCVYPSGTTFTPSTAPLTAITNTSLLTCQSNRFIDNSSNAFTITRNGDVSVQRFSPFNPTTPYAAATIGGSGYFDGSGDYLGANYTINWSTYGSYTLEFWVYHTTMAPANQMYFAGGTGGTDNTIFYNYANGRIGLGINGANEIVSGSGVIKANTWQHVAYTFNGTTTKIYVDGVEVASGTTAIYANSSVTLSVGGGSASSSFVMNGYMANLRLSQSVIYTTAFTPPTSPVTGGALLLNFTNGGIIDNAMMNDLETVGNAQISTSVSKFGGGSMAFDGSGDYCFSPANPLYAFNTGDFTVEMWVYFNALASNQTVAGTASTYLSGGWQLIQLASTTLSFLIESNPQKSVTTGTLSTGQWYHIAVTRSGTTLRIFVNGVLADNATSSENITDNAGNKFVVGNTVELSAGRYLNGYIDDFRLTKGYARYTANFTPPTLPFPDQ